MVARIRDMCRDPAVAVAGLEDGLVPENDDFYLGKVRKSKIPGEGSTRGSVSLRRQLGKTDGICSSLVQTIDLASLQRRDGGAFRVFTAQVFITCKLEAPWGVRRVS